MSQYDSPRPEEQEPLPSPQIVAETIQKTHGDDRFMWSFKPGMGLMVLTDGASGTQIDRQSYRGYGGVVAETVANIVHTKLSPLEPQQPLQVAQEQLRAAITLALQWQQENIRAFRSGNQDARPGDTTLLVGMYYQAAEGAFWLTASIGNGFLRITGPETPTRPLDGIDLRNERLKDKFVMTTKPEEVVIQVRPHEENDRLLLASDGLEPFMQPLIGAFRDKKKTNLSNAFYLYSQDVIPMVKSAIGRNGQPLFDGRSPQAPDDVTIGAITLEY